MASRDIELARGANDNMHNNELISVSCRWGQAEKLDPLVQADSALALRKKKHSYDTPEFRVEL